MFQTERKVSSKFAISWWPSTSPSSRAVDEGGAAEERRPGGDAAVSDALQQRHQRVGFRRSAAPRRRAAGRNDFFFYSSRRRGRTETSNRRRLRPKKRNSGPHRPGHSKPNALRANPATTGAHRAVMAPTKTLSATYWASITVDDAIDVGERADAPADAVWRRLLGRMRRRRQFQIFQLKEGSRTLIVVGIIEFCFIQFVSTSFLWSILLCC